MKIIKRFIISSMGVNCYLIEHNGKIILIDAPSGMKKVIKYLAENELKLDYLLITHIHFDHILGAQELYDANLIDCVYVAPDEIKLFNENGQFGNMGQNYGVITNFQGEIYSLETLDLPGLEVSYIYGHSPQSAIFIFKDSKTIFSGDTLFKDSIGRSDFPGGSHENLVFGIHSEILPLVDFKVYPGHGFPTNTSYETNNQHLN